METPSRVEADAYIRALCQLRDMGRIRCTWVPGMLPEGAPPSGPRWEPDDGQWLVMPAVTDPPTVGGMLSLLREAAFNPRLSVTFSKVAAAWVVAGVGIDPVESYVSEPDAIMRATIRLAREWSAVENHLTGTDFSQLISFLLRGGSEGFTAEEVAARCETEHGRRIVYGVATGNLHPDDVEYLRVLHEQVEETIRTRNR